MTSVAAAVTRAKQLVIVVGQEGAIRKAVEEIYGDVRLSSLCERLQVYQLIHLFEHLGITEYPASELLSKDVSEIQHSWLVFCLLLLSLRGGTFSVFKEPIYWECAE